jgi:AraC-like DNA-binding protein
MTITHHQVRLPTGQEFEQWRDAISTAFVPLTASTTNEKQFTGVLVSHPLGAVQLSSVGGGPVTVDRDRTAIRRADPEYYKLGLQVRGYCVVTQDGREAALTPGDFALYDTSRPYALSFDRDFQMLVVMFPRTLLRVKSRQAQELTARRISGRQGLGAIVAPFLLQLNAGLASQQVTASTELADAVLDLLGATLSGQLHDSGDVPAGTYRHALLLQIKAFIDARLGDPELTTSTIASAHHVSVRYLQKLFEAEGTTVTEWLRSRRLERCRRDLLDPSTADFPSAPSPVRTECSMPRTSPGCSNSHTASPRAATATTPQLLRNLATTAEELFAFQPPHDST